MSIKSQPLENAMNAIPLSDTGNVTAKESNLIAYICPDQKSASCTKETSTEKAGKSGSAKNLEQACQSSPNPEERKKLDEEPWAAKYRPGMASFRNFFEMDDDLDRIKEWGTGIAYFDSAKTRKEAGKDFDPAWTQTRMDGLKLAADGYEDSYARQKQCPGRPDQLSPSERNTYQLATARADQLEPTIAQIAKLLQSPVKADLNDPNFVKLAHLAAQIEQATDKPECHLHIAQDPVEQASDAYLNTSIPFEKEDWNRMLAQLKSPEAMSLLHQSEALNKYEGLSKVLNDLNNSCFDICGDSDQSKCFNKDDVVNEKNHARELIRNAYQIADEEQMKKDLSDPQLAGQQKLMGDCLTFWSQLKPYIQRVDCALNEDSAGELKRSTRDYYYQNNVWFNQNPFIDSVFSERLNINKNLFQAAEREKKQ